MAGGRAPLRVRESSSTNWHRAGGALLVSSSEGRGEMETAGGDRMARRELELSLSCVVPPNPALTGTEQCQGGVGAMLTKQRGVTGWVGRTR